MPNVLFRRSVGWIFADHTLVHLYIYPFVASMLIEWMSTTIERTTIFMHSSIPTFVYDIRGCCLFGCCFTAVDRYSKTQYRIDWKYDMVSRRRFLHFWDDVDWSNTMLLLLSCCCCYSWWWWW